MQRSAPFLFVVLAAVVLVACGGSSQEGATRDGSARFQEASELVRSERWPEAVAVLDELADEDPQVPAVWLLLAQARRRSGDLAGALEASSTAAGFPAARGGALQQEFLTRIASGDRDTALALYRALRAFPVVDLSGLHLGPELDAVRGDERFAMLFPQQFDDPFVEGARVLHEWRGSGPGQELGWEARNVGDVDGDGVSDAVMSAPANQPGGDSSGTVFVYSGASGELLWQARGEPGDQLGMGVESAGDVNGDGTPDVVAGAPGSERVYVYDGRTGKVLRTFKGSEADEGGFGAKAAGTGDIDLDGLGDLVVGSPAADGGAGAAYVYSGADGSLLARYEGDEGSALGSTVAGGAGFVVVGAPNAGAEGRGEVLVYRGAAAAPSFVIQAEPTGRRLGGMFASVVGDVDADGTPDIYASDWQDASDGPVTGRIYVHSGATGERLLTLVGEGAGQGFGIGPARAGDVNGDGHADLVIGAWQYGGAAHSGGRVYVYSGQDGSLLRTYTGKIPGETLGFDADGLGDVDGDGEIDFLVTSAWSLVNGPRSGRVLVVSGAAASPEADESAGGS